MTSGGVATDATPRALARRLRPLQVAVGLQGMALWVPVEKLFMSQIGFDAGSVAVMAAAYAAVVPLLEMPSGILADRGSRRLMMVAATAALAASSLLGGLSRNVPTYIAAAMILGVYFAVNSGTIDSVVYDVVLEETGSNDLYETWVGRVRMVESAAFVLSALGGGVLAGWTSARFTYFATLPFMLLAVAAFLRFDEPRLHRAAEPVALRQHVATTVRAMTRQRAVLLVVLLAALASVVSQTVFEFGPLWLVALHAAPGIYGPYWAALVSTLGLGGYLVSRLRLGSAGTVVPLAFIGPVAALGLVLSRSLVLVILAQVALALLLAVIAIHVGKLLHDAVPSTVRTGVSSGVGTMSWLLFLPFSLVFGWLARARGVGPSAWTILGATTVVAVLLVVPVLRPPRTGPPARAAAEGGLACQELVELVADYLDKVLPAEQRAAMDEHLAGCDGCTDYLEQIRLVVQALQRSAAAPSIPDA